MIGFGFTCDWLKKFFRNDPKPKRELISTHILQEQYNNALPFPTALQNVPSCDALKSFCFRDRGSLELRVGRCSELICKSLCRLM